MARLRPERGPDRMHPVWRNLADVGGLSNTVDVTSGVVYGIRSAVAGTVKVTNTDGTTATMQFTAGETRACNVTRLWATGTLTIVAADLEVAHAYLEN